MTLSEKSAYLKGLMEGMKLDTETNEGKLISEIISMLQDVAENVSDLEEVVDCISDELDCIEEDLDNIDDYLMDDDDDEYDDYDEDEDYEDDEDDDDQNEYDFGSETLYEVKCPTCGEVITIDEEMLDEPTNHLDLIYQKQIFALIGQWLQTPGRAVVSVVHDLSLARAFGTDALLMDSGRKIALGRANDVLTPANLDRVYGMDVAAWMRGLYSQWAE